MTTELAKRLVAKLLGRPYRHGGYRPQFASQRLTSQRRQPPRPPRYPGKR